MPQYAINYYTGSSSLGYAATASLKGDYLEITYTNELEELITVKWLLADIRKSEISSAINTFRYGTFPYQTIECSSDELTRSLLKDTGFVQQQYFWLFNKDWRLIAACAALFIGTLIMAYFFLLPNFAVFVANRLPQQYEIEAGEHLYTSIMSEYSKDEEMSQLVNDFAQEIDFQTTYPIEISVVKKDELNAFALPGGKIVVYDKLLKSMSTPEELAGLLAHEVSHVKFRHSLQSISRSMAGYIMISFLLGDINGITVLLVENVELLNRLSYSRNLEQEADQEALQIMKQNHIDQHGFVRLLQTLQEENNVVAIKFLSTHPLTSSRIEMAQVNAKHQQQIATKPALVEAWEKIKKEFPDDLSDHE